MGQYWLRRSFIEFLLRGRKNRKKVPRTRENHGAGSPGFSGDVDRGKIVLTRRLDHQSKLPSRRRRSPASSLKRVGSGRVRPSYVRYGRKGADWLQFKTRYGMLAARRFVFLCEAWNATADSIRDFDFDRELYQHSSPSADTAPSMQGLSASCTSDPHLRSVALAQLRAARE